MNSDYIHSFLLDEDLSSKVELIKIFEHHFKQRESQDELRALIVDHLMTINSSHRITNFDMVRFYGPGKGLSLYVANQLLLALNVESFKNKMSVLKGLNNVLDSFYDSKNPLLKVTKAKLLIDLLRKFLGDHFHKITHQRFLSIYFVPYETKINNAAFDLNTNSIAVFRTKAKKTQTPEYIFVHEFGHVLHCTLFRSITEVPKSFVDFNQKMNPNFFNYSKLDQLEIYADLFSIAVMLDTEFANHNPFIKTMQRAHLDAIREYFIKDLSTLN